MPTLINEHTQTRTKEKQKQGKSAVQHGLVVGDVLYLSWGYEQTNINFYEVVRVPSGRSAVVREIEKDIVPGKFSSGYGVATPKIGCFKPNSPETLRRTIEANCVGSKTDREFLKKWNGKPRHVSWYA